MTDAERLEKVRGNARQLVRLIEAGVSGTGTDHHRKIEDAAYRLDRALNETASEGKGPRRVYPEGEGPGEVKKLTPEETGDLFGNPVARFQGWLNRR